jgi:hypothetical protein
MQDASGTVAVKAVVSRVSCSDDEKVMREWDMDVRGLEVRDEGASSKPRERKCECRSSFHCHSLIAASRGFDLVERWLLYL